MFSNWYLQELATTSKADEKCKRWHCPMKQNCLYILKIGLWKLDHPHLKWDKVGCYGYSDRRVRISFEEVWGSPHIDSSKSHLKFFVSLARFWNSNSKWCQMLTFHPKTEWMVPLDRSCPYLNKIGGDFKIMTWLPHGKMWQDPQNSLSPCNTYYGLRIKTSRRFNTKGIWMAVRLWVEGR